MSDQNAVTLSGFVTGRVFDLGGKGVKFDLDVPMGKDRSGNDWRGPVPILAWSSDCAVPPIRERDTVTVRGFLKRQPMYRGEGFELCVTAQSVEVE